MGKRPSFGNRCRIPLLYYIFRTLSLVFAKKVLHGRSFGILNKDFLRDLLRGLDFLAEIVYNKVSITFDQT